MTNRDETKLPKWVQDILRSLRFRIKGNEESIKKLEDKLSSPPPSMYHSKTLTVDLDEIVEMFLADLAKDTWKIKYRNGMTSSYNHCGDVCKAWLDYKRYRYYQQMRKVVR